MPFSAIRFLGLSLRPALPSASTTAGLTSVLIWLLSAMHSSSASAQMGIDEISITAGPGYLGGFFSDFFVDPVVFGSGIDSIVITSQSGTLDEELFEVTPGEFACDRAIPRFAVGDALYEQYLAGGAVDPCAGKNVSPRRRHSQMINT